MCHLSAALGFLQFLESEDPASVVLRDAVGCEKTHEFESNHYKNELEPEEAVEEAHASQRSERARNLRLFQSEKGKVERAENEVAEDAELEEAHPLHGHFSREISEVHMEVVQVVVVVVQIGGVLGAVVVRSGHF
mmetsp:Transcript_42405/g.55915  ORF Transcript_42405/g.55915 Transcript_42405/m.55915 type:complete len:135 (+) Transcript_42405:1203-1607(+)